MMPPGALKRLTIALLVMAIVMLTAPWFIARWGIGIDTQRNPSNPFRIYLHCKQDRDIHYGTYAPFAIEGFAPVIADGTLFVKRVVAMEGDKIDIERSELLVNGRVVARINPVILGRAGLARSRLEDTHVVPAGYALLLGSSSDSFDGRYFGLVALARLQGTAVPVW